MSTWSKAYSCSPLWMAQCNKCFVFIFRCVATAFRWGQSRQWKGTKQEVRARGRRCHRPNPEWIGDAPEGRSYCSTAARNPRAALRSRTSPPHRTVSWMNAILRLPGAVSYGTGRRSALGKRQRMVTMSVWCLGGERGWAPPSCTTAMTARAVTYSLERFLPSAAVPWLTVRALKRSSLVKRAPQRMLLLGSRKCLQNWRNL